MSRTKPQSEPVLKSWAEVDEALHQIIDAEAAVAKYELVMNSKITKLIAAAERDTKPLHERVKELGLQVKEFVAAHKDELDGKTKKLNFGSTGFRRSTKLVVPKGADADVIAALKAMGLLDCVKTTEAIKKDILKQKPEAVILKTGAYLKPTDEFWYETHQEELQDTSG